MSLITADAGYRRGEPSTLKPAADVALAELTLSAAIGAGTDVTEGCLPERPLAAEDALATKETLTTLATMNGVPELALLSL